MGESERERRHADGSVCIQAVAAGMYDVLHLDYRKEATKICVLIADAPPHGLEQSGDNYPNGDPEGRDPIKIAREMAELGIVVYTVGCEPALGGYTFARDFMRAVADITGGQNCALERCGHSVCLCVVC